jgi:hypothetical protein
MTIARYREVRALEMAVQGWEWPAISDELGYADRSGAWKAAQRALKRRAATAVDSYRRMMLAELDMVQDSAWGAAMRGNMRASEVVVRAIDQRVRLLGLDQPEDAEPVKSQVSVTCKRPTETGVLNLLLD